MKKSIVTLSVLCLLILAYSMVPAQDTVSAESDFIIINYSAYGRDIYVYNGGEDEKPITCKKRDVNNCVVELLSTYKAKGYEVTSITSGPPSYKLTDKFSELQMF